MTEHYPRYNGSADVALTHDDDRACWVVVTGPLHPYGVDAVSYPSYWAAVRAYRATVWDALDRN